MIAGFAIALALILMGTQCVLWAETARHGLVARKRRRVGFGLLAVGCLVMVATSWTTVGA